MDDPVPTPDDDQAAPSGGAPRRLRERGSSTIEYVGLGSLATMLVTGIAAAIDSAAGDRVAAAVVRRLIAAVSGSE
ncbi:MAG: hypothetical protein JWL76_2306 [Thermoleophilia bacterium]|nr:hypothetical protein [Thermoleophilia bacterium]